MNNKILSIFMRKNSSTRQKNHIDNSSLYVVGACRDTLKQPRGSVILRDLFFEALHSSPERSRAKKKVAESIDRLRLPCFAEATQGRRARARYKTDIVKTGTVIA